MTPLGSPWGLGTGRARCGLPSGQQCRPSRQPGSCRARSQDDRVGRAWGSPCRNHLIHTFFQPALSNDRAASTRCSSASSSRPLPWAATRAHPSPRQVRQGRHAPRGAPRPHCACALAEQPALGSARCKHGPRLLGGGRAKCASAGGRRPPARMRRRARKAARMRPGQRAAGGVRRRNQAAQARAQARCGAVLCGRSGCCSRRRCRCQFRLLLREADRAPPPQSPAPRPWPGTTTTSSSCSSSATAVRGAGLGWAGRLRGGRGGAGRGREGGSGVGVVAGAEGRPPASGAGADPRPCPAGAVFVPRAWCSGLAWACAWGGPRGGLDVKGRETPPEARGRGGPQACGLPRGGGLGRAPFGLASGLRSAPFPTAAACSLEPELARAEQVTSTVSLRRGVDAGRRSARLRMKHRMIAGSVTSAALCQETAACAHKQQPCLRL